MLGTVCQNIHIYCIIEEEMGKNGEVIEVVDVRWRGVGGVHDPICDGPDAVPWSEVFYPKRYL